MECFYSTISNPRTKELVEFEKKYHILWLSKSYPHSSESDSNYFAQIFLPWWIFTCIINCLGMCCENTRIYHSRQAVQSVKTRISAQTTIFGYCDALLYNFRFSLCCTVIILLIECNQIILKAYDFLIIIIIKKTAHILSFMQC